MQAGGSPELYDRALEPAGVTIGQFGLLAFLDRVPPEAAVAIGVLAEARGMDPTTLTRNLKPLLEHGWVTQRPHPHDRRVRAVAITADGREKYVSALPLWRSAEVAVGNEARPRNARRAQRAARGVRQQDRILSRVVVVWRG